MFGIKNGKKEKKKKKGGNAQAYVAKPTSRDSAYRE
jgi:hypothetical protein